jgi:CheY-like chemotaxis protein
MRCTLDRVVTSDRRCRNCLSDIWCPDRYDLIFIDLDEADAAGVTGFSASNTIRQQGYNTDTPIVGWSSIHEVGSHLCFPSPFSHSHQCHVRVHLSILDLLRRDSLWREEVEKNTCGSVAVAVCVCVCVCVCVQGTYVYRVGVVVFQAGGIQEVQVRATESGINDVIGKPFNVKNVSDMIVTWGTLRVEPLPQVVISPTSLLSSSPPLPTSVAGCQLCRSRHPYHPSFAPLGAIRAAADPFLHRMVVAQFWPAVV